MENRNPVTTILPCPFCGAEAKLHHDTQSDYPRHWAYAVMCTDLDACSAEGLHDATADEAITWWNRRVQNVAA